MNSNPPHKENIAYIDAANLDKALKYTLKWKLDYKKLRVWLAEKYNVTKAYMFIGMIPKHKSLYTYLQNCEFKLIFKEVLYHNTEPKGNCDTDLVTKSLVDLYEGFLNEAIIVASDGDYAPLVKILQSKNSLKTIVSPAPPEKCSILLKRTNARITYLNDKRNALQSKKEKAPDGDETP